jgi:hypothetical protein
MDAPTCMFVGLTLHTTNQPVTVTGLPVRVRELAKRQVKAPFDGPPS